MVMNPACLLLADTLAAAVTWHKLYRHKARNVLERTSFTSVILCDGMFQELSSSVDVIVMPLTV